jgi:hypothetical protein
VKRPTAAIFLLALLAGVVWVTGAFGADRAVSGDTTTGNLSAYVGTLVWSREAPAGTHRLVTFSPRTAPLLGPAPRPTDLAVRPSDSPFDPDVGMSKRGTPQVLYTRCAGVSGRNCDVYRFDGKQESKVEGASSRRCSEFAPSVWRGTVAFGRSGPRKCEGLYVKGDRGKALRLDKRIPADTDILRGEVAYLHFPSSRRSVIRVFTIRKGRSHVAVAGVRAQRERTRVSSPTFAGRFLYWLHEDLRRRDFTVGRTRASVSSVLEWSDRSLPGAVDSIAVEGRKLYYTNGRGVRQATDPVPRFSARD